MKTIRIEKVDKEMPSPDGNPLILRAAEDYSLNFGDVRHLSTGLHFYFPADVRCMFDTMIPGLVILDRKQDDPDGPLQLIAFCCTMQVRLGRMQLIAKMTFFEMKPAAVRFAEFGEGKRLVFGGAVETVTDNDGSKPGA